MRNNNVIDVSNKFNFKKFIPAIIAVIAVIIVAVNCFSIVEPGHTGVIVTLGKVKNSTLQEGIHVKAPFVQQVVKIDNRILKLEVETEAFSKDLQTVTTTLAVNYRVDSSKSYSIYKNIGADYETVLVTPAINEVLKAITAKYTAEESVTNRALISEGLVKGLNEKLNDIGLYVTDVNIINFDFSEAFITAIEEKQVAQQKLLKAETEKQTAITNAEAEAETIKIKADAEADANNTLNKSLTDKIIEYNKIDKWNGILPQVTGNSSSLIDMGSLNSKGK
ncbi:MAG: prohibitin family protein [Clostridia bacterium]|nr:prohibitin family protein [Clostridia bacterium]